MSATERVIVIYGEDDYLRRQAEDEIRTGFGAVIGLDLQQLRHDELIARACQRDLFRTEAQLYVMRGKDEPRSLWKTLLAVQTKLCHVLLFNCGKKSLSAAACQTLQTLNAKLLACPAPRPYEYDKHLHRICARHDLHLDCDGQRLLLAHGGLQLATLANEVQKLALIFGTSDITAADIAPHLGLLREDHSFVIIDLLLNRQYSRAQLVVEDLLRRGASPLALLGVLAYFLRNVITAGEGQLKLSPRQVTRYRSLARICQPDTCLELLAFCQQADMALKTSRLRPELILGEILLRLSSCTA